MNLTKKSIYSNILTEFLLFPMSLIIGILISKTLGPFNKGIYSFIVLLNNIFIPILLLGFNGGIKYYISIKEFKVEKVIFSIISLSFLWGFAISFVFYILWYLGLLGNTGNLLTLQQIILLIIPIPFNVIFLFLNKVLQANFNFVLGNKILIFYQIINITLLSLFVLIFNFELTGILWSMLISKILYGTVLIIISLKTYKQELTVNIEFIAKSFTFGMKSWLTQIVTLTNSRVDQILIGYLLTPASLGLYSIAVNLSEILIKVPASIITVIHNKMAVNDKSNNVILLRKTNNLLLITTLLSSILIIILGYYFIPIVYGPSFAFSSDILIWYIPGVIFFLFTRLITSYFLATGKPLTNTLIQLSGIIVAVPLYFILIEKFDVIGAAISSTIAYIITSAVAIYFYKKDIYPLNADLLKIHYEDYKWTFLKVKETIFGFLNRIKLNIIK